MWHQLAAHSICGCGEQDVLLFISSFLAIDGPEAISNITPKDPETLGAQSVPLYWEKELLICAFLTCVLWAFHDAPTRITLTRMPAFAMPGRRIGHFVSLVKPPTCTVELADDNCDANASSYIKRNLWVPPPPPHVLSCRYAKRRQISSVRQTMWPQMINVVLQLP